MSKSSLINRKEFPAVSIMFPVDKSFLKNTTHRLLVNKLIGEAKDGILKKYSEEKATMLTNKLHRLVNSMQLSGTTQSVALFVSQNEERIVYLPHLVFSRVVVDDSFHIRDLIYSAQQNKTYLLLVLSLNGASVYTGYGKTLTKLEMEGIESKAIDTETSRSRPGRDYIDSSAFDEKRMEKFLRMIDTEIKKQISSDQIPVILAGEKKVTSVYQKLSKIKKQIAGSMQGNFDRAKPAELAEKARPILEELVQLEIKEKLTLLNDSISKGLCRTGIQSVWRSAMEGKGRLLLVEKDYHQEARYGDNAYSIVMDDAVESAKNKISDAVDDVTEVVLKNNGEVIFVENGLLKDHQRIALVTRY